MSCKKTCALLFCALMAFCLGAAQIPISYICEVCVRLGPSWGGVITDTEIAVRIFLVVATVIFAIALLPITIEME